MSDVVAGAVQGQGQRAARIPDVADVARGDGAVGIWHETYVVPAGNTETIYGNMPLLGLGHVQGVVPVGKRGDTAAERLKH
jgi:hypothetical protein